MDVTYAGVVRRVETLQHVFLDCPVTISIASAVRLIWADSDENWAEKLSTMASICGRNSWSSFLLYGSVFGTHGIMFGNWQGKRHPSCEDTLQQATHIICIKPSRKPINSKLTTPNNPKIKSLKSTYLEGDAKGVYDCISKAETITHTMVVS